MARTKTMFKSLSVRHSALRRARKANSSGSGFFSMIGRLNDASDRLHRARRAR